MSDYKPCPCGIHPSRCTYHKPSPKRVMVKIDDKPAEFVGVFGLAELEELLKQLDDR